jgi:cytochrome c-type biogenesis protein CcmH
MMRALLPSILLRAPMLPRASALLLTWALLASALMMCAAPTRAEQAPAWDDHAQLQDPLLQTRFERITKELRCLVCQNESIADSNVDLAADLRRQVREMLVAGRSDDAIFKFMTDRYGEFVRFAPPLSAKTALIWGAPFFMLLLGGLIIYRVVRQRSRMPLDE